MTLGELFGAICFLFSVVFLHFKKKSPCACPCSGECSDAGNVLWTKKLYLTFLG